MTKIHFVEGDTVSMYWAVSGSNSDDYLQGFKHVIKDHKFYNENIYKFTPSSFYFSDNNNPTFNSEIQKIQFDKKPLGLAIEKQCENMIALSPKTYSCSVNDKITATKCKGYTKQGKLYFKDYFDVYAERKFLQGINKYHVSKDFSTCTPLFLEVDD
jgi:hypothetical protein